MASNYVAALIYGATEILKVVGVERSMALSTLAPLVRAATENALKLGSMEYCCAGGFTVEMTLLRGLPEAKAAQIKQMLRTAQ
jgi:predicted short-subunit dehydrogenase-like oxidoreductase (DUF2520 family)